MDTCPHCSRDFSRDMDSPQITSPVIDLGIFCQGTAVTKKQIVNEYGRVGHGRFSPPPLPLCCNVFNRTLKIMLGEETAVSDEQYAMKRIRPFFVDC